jgi:hypothetical protein
MNYLPPQTTRKLIELFDLASQSIAGESGQYLKGLPAWQLARLTQGYSDGDISPWLNQVGYASVYETDWMTDYEVVELEEDDNPDFVRYRDPDTFRWQRLPLSDTAVYDVKTDVFLNSLANLLDIPSIQREGIARASIQGCLWKLGSSRFDAGLNMPVFVVRNLDRHLDAVVEVLRKENTSALLLSCSKKDPQVTAWPAGVVIDCLPNAFIPHLPETRIDQSRLLQLISTGSVLSGSEHNLPVFYDPQRKVLSIQGKSDWYVSGDKQAKVIAFMYQQALSDRWELTANEILTGANIKTRTGGSVRMQSLFKGSLQWEDYVSNPRRGKYAFNLS